MTSREKVAHYKELHDQLNKLEDQIDEIKKSIFQPIADAVVKQGKYKNNWCPFFDFYDSENDVLEITFEDREGTFDYLKIHVDRLDTELTEEDLLTENNLKSIKEKQEKELNERKEYERLKEKFGG